MKSDSYSLPCLSYIEFPQLPHHANSCEKHPTELNQTNQNKGTPTKSISHPLFPHPQFYGASCNWWPAEILSGSKLTGNLKSLLQSTGKKEWMPAQYGPRAQLKLLHTQLRALQCPDWQSCRPCLPCAYWPAGWRPGHQHLHFSDMYLKVKVNSTEGMFTKGIGRGVFAHF